uniref:AP180 N-terminal homology (ANTH) domain-containing protein n=2 Tax=Vitis vinifera TaxID=29760 RepID=A5ADQ4_VITVI|nr:hypothetical protein VITISV_008492 [Vitis vinifera]
MKQIQQILRGGILKPHNIKRLGRKCDDGCFRRRVIIRPLLNMFKDVKGPTSLEFVTTYKIYAEVIENAWQPFPACECVELYGAITNEILNLVDKYFEMQKHDAVRALEIYQKAGEPSSIHSTSKRIRLLLTIERIHRTLKGKLPKLFWQEEWEGVQMYRDGMWAMFRKEGSDHAGLTWMIEALSRLPKLIINNIDVCRHAILTDDSTVCASMYHDRLLWKIIALGVNERCLPVVLVTSDSYHSYQAYLDFRFPNIFISRETFGWTPQEAKLHMVTDYFSHSELAVIADVLGPNPRHMFELYALQQSNYYRKVMEDSGSTFEDIIDAYLSYLQITVVNPAMDKALKLLEKFVVDRLRFGAPWRHPPRIDNPTLCSEWTKLQLIDFVQSLVYPSLGRAINHSLDKQEKHIGRTILQQDTTTYILEEVIENAWPPFPACECVELYGAITNEILNLVDKYFEMQKHDVVRALEIYQKAGEPSTIHSTSKRNT